VFVLILSGATVFKNHQNLENFKLRKGSFGIRSASCQGKPNISWSNQVRRLTIHLCYWIQNVNRGMYWHILLILFYWFFFVLISVISFKNFQVPRDWFLHYSIKITNLPGSLFLQCDLKPYLKFQFITILWEWNSNLFVFTGVLSFCSPISRIFCSVRPTIVFVYIVSNMLITVVCCKITFHNNVIYEITINLFMFSISPHTQT
jgi:hypothetical protein